MRIIRFISRILIGVLFIYSGFVKGVDPYGFTYKLIDYFIAFGMDSFEPLAFPLSILLSSIEFIIGIALLFGVRMVIAAWAALLFMIFFTPLTFYLAIANPVHDCGCFGDALILSNWETFFKNLIILIPTIFTFIYRKDYKIKYRVYAEWVLLSAFTVIIVFTSVYSLKHLPILDFRPYKIGTYIPDGMNIPNDAPQAVYKTIATYEKDGVSKEFILPDYADSTWTWVSTDNELISAGYEPPIHDFSIENMDGDDITDDILYDEGFTCILVAYNLAKSNIDAQQKINELSDYCLTHDHRFICLTASTDDIYDFIDNTEAPYEFCNTDEITLKTIIRSNPGLVILHKGTILSKLHYNDIPEINELNDNLLAYAVNKQREKSDSLLVTSLVLSLLLLLSLFVLINFLKPKRN